MLINTLPPLTRNVTCAVTGHRILSGDFDREKLIKTLDGIIGEGYEYFLDGMALGFDMECFRALEYLRSNGRNIKIIAVTPCSDQAARFPAKARAEYYRMLESADTVIAEPDAYFEGCMLKRNDFLVENSSLVLAGYRNVKRGGTFYTINKAVSLGVTVREFA